MSETLNYDRSGFSFPLETSYAAYYANEYLDRDQSWELLGYVKTTEKMILSIQDERERMRIEILELKAELYDLQKRT